MARKIEMINAAINTDPTRINKSLGSRNIKQLRINDKDVALFYTFGETLGTGSFGTVLSVIDKDTNKEWAMKIIAKPTVSTQLKAIEREISILKMVNHPNIIYLERIFVSSKTIYLILEKCDRELSKLLQEKVTLSEDEARKILTELLNAVSYLHSNDIIHRDLKLENILVTTNPNDEKDHLYVKLADFGLSIIKTGHNDMVQDKCGTLRYISPEIILSQSYSQQCDVWALGIILYMLLIGTPPFNGKSEELSNLICNNDPPFELCDAILKPPILHLLENMLEKNPAARITASEALRHPWLSLKPFSSYTPATNILEMMRLWNSDLKAPQGVESDRFPSNHSDIRKTPVSSKLAHATVPMSVKNIEFDRKQRKSGDESKIKNKK